MLRMGTKLNLRMDRFAWISLAALLALVVLALVARQPDAAPEDAKMAVLEPSVTEVTEVTASEGLGVCLTDAMASRIGQLYARGMDAEAAALLKEGEDLCLRHQDDLGYAAFLAEAAAAVLENSTDMKTAEELFRKLEAKSQASHLPADDPAKKIFSGYQIVALQGLESIYREAAHRLRMEGKTADAEAYQTHANHYAAAAKQAIAAVDKTEH